MCVHDAMITFYVFPVGYVFFDDLCGKKNFESEIDNQYLALRLITMPTRMRAYGLDIRIFLFVKTIITENRKNERLLCD